MPRWLLPLLYLLVFLPVGIAFSAQLWPIVTGRPVPEAFGDELLALSILGLMLSAFVTMLLIASQRDDRMHR